MMIITEKQQQATIILIHHLSNAMASFNVENTCPFAEALGRKFETKPNYITNDGSSWYILVKQWFLPTTQADFDAEWDLHPKERKKVKLFGKVVDERRWSQAWGTSMSYSGLEQSARPIEESTILPIVIERVNNLMKEYKKELKTSNTFENNDRNDTIDENMEDIPLYNACLQNWYEPIDIIGLHCDDESYLIPGLPIFSLSWGGTRRFLFRSKQKKEQSIGKVELWLESGDLLIMGGTCQETHKHEEPKVRSTMDPATYKRINWTIRGIQD